MADYHGFFAKSGLKNAVLADYRGFFAKSGSLFAWWSALSRSNSYKTLSKSHKMINGQLMLNHPESLNKMTAETGAVASDLSDLSDLSDVSKAMGGWGGDGCDLD